jgi:hypothetical protein
MVSVVERDSHLNVMSDGCYRNVTSDNSLCLKRHVSGKMPIFRP